jgi:branched-chain amino acid transport system substrate-binding protein
LAADDIVIGFATAQSGMMVPADGDGFRMAQLWMKQTNAKGGLLGKQLKAVSADTKSDRIETAKAGQTVLNEGAAIVVVSCDYDFGAPAALQAQRAGVISVSLCAGDPKMGVLGVGSLSFSASVAAQSEGAALAQFSWNDKKFKTAYLLRDDSIEYDKSLCSGFEWRFSALGGKIVGTDSFKSGDPTIASQITRLANAMKSEKIDEIMLCSYVVGGPPAIRQIRATGIDLPIFAGSGMDGTFWLAAVPHLNQFYLASQVSIFDDPRADVGALKAAFKEEYGSEPVTSLAYPIYVWLQLWSRAVTKTGTTDSKTVVQEMETYTDAPTALGPRSFNHETHIQTSIPFVINLIEDGQGKVVGNTVAPNIPREILYRVNKN